MSDAVPAQGRTPRDISWLSCRSTISIRSNDKGGRNTDADIRDRTYLCESFENFLKVSRRFPCPTILRPLFDGLNPTFKSASPTVSLVCRVSPLEPTASTLGASFDPLSDMPASRSSDRFYYLPNTRANRTTSMATAKPELTRDYETNARSVSDQQVSLAATRFANLLNTALADP
ncbi:hypothetical protein [Rhizobium leguminosarum]|uniref:hypothetical protein n=1 Tax=Rhizobium leguminosarum TaxID=384 RepID=UPI0014423143|nr:hypothetical protein [Rhizobium leguminosarum]MBY5794881.1 hypothetical protein [Rhizobium leguminosarum]NKK32500.1 hypothetical protein [Rhizobium leguminosarum bv. viciae]